MAQPAEQDGRDVPDVERRRSWPGPEPCPPGDTRCELTVAGVLGPVLAHACRTDARAEISTCTVVRARLPQDLDLPELVRMLVASRLRLVDVTVLGRSADGRAASPVGARRP